MNKYSDTDLCDAIKNCSAKDSKLAEQFMQWLGMETYSTLLDQYREVADDFIEQWKYEVCGLCGNTFDKCHAACKETYPE